MDQLVDPVSGCSLETLKNVDTGERPTGFIAERSEQQVNVIGHHNNRMKINPSRCGAGALARGF